MKVKILDPRPQSRDSEIQWLNDHKGRVVGFEVTVPEFADLCLINIDPQHGFNGDSSMSCIKAVAEGLIGPDMLRLINDSLAGAEEFYFVTIRPDLDAFGAMAVQMLTSQYGELSLAAREGTLPSHAFEIVEQIHKADSFSNGEWKSCKLFEGGFDNAELGPMARAIADFKIDANIRYEWMRAWLEFGVEPEGYRSAYKAEQNKIRSAIESGETTKEVHGDVVLVKSDLPVATGIWYSDAPVVISYNPRFLSGHTVPGREPDTIVKYTICQYALGYCNIKAALTELNELEPGWGGSPTIGGSPQGISSKLTPEQVLKCVQKHLLV